MFILFYTYYIYYFIGIIRLPKRLYTVWRLPEVIILYLLQYECVYAMVTCARVLHITDVVYGIYIYIILYLKS